MRHIMLDLETMGTSPGSAIVQIGAVEFTKTTLGNPLDIRVSLESCVRSGLTIDPKTVLWWMKQSNESREVMDVSGYSLHESLKLFTAYIGGDDACLWGDGVAFDNCLLMAAYRIADISPPWSFWSDRCFRTIKNLFHVDSVKSATAHNAMEDAVAQAKQMQLILDRYGISLEK